MRFWITVIVGIVFISAVSTAMVVWNPDTFASRADQKYRPKPLDPYLGQKVPKFEYDERLIKVPGVQQLTQGETVFPLRNEGDSELQLRLGSKSCTCAAIRIEKNGEVLTRFAKAKELEDAEAQKAREEDPNQRELIHEAVKGQGNVNPAGVVVLAPGESAQFVVEWDSKDTVGTKQIGGEVFSNDPRSDRRAVMFDVVLDIVPELLFEPRYVNFGQLREDQLREETLYIYSMAHDDLTVEYVSSSTPVVSAEIQPMSEEKKVELKAKSGYTAIVRANGKLPVGDFLEAINLKTNLKQQPDVRVTVAGMVNGMIEVHPGTIDFGVVADPSESHFKVSISTRGLPAEETLAVDEKQIRPDFIGATLRRHEDSNQVWILDAFIKPGAPVGRIKADPFVFGNIPIVDSKGDVRVNVSVKGTIAGEP